MTAKIIATCAKCGHVLQSPDEGACPKCGSHEKHINAVATEQIQVTEQALVETRSVPTPRVEPSLFLFQPSYPLSEANFLRLRQPSPAWVAAGGTVLGFGLGQGLPALVEVLRQSADARVWPVSDLIVAAIAVAIGIAVLLVGYFYPSERRGVMKRIQEHFEQHPGEHKVQ